MEHMTDWLVAAVKTKHLHLAFLTGILLMFKKEKRGHYLDLGELGDNVPHVFLKPLPKRYIHG